MFFAGSASNGRRYDSSDRYRGSSRRYSGSRYSYSYASPYVYYPRVRPGLSIGYYDDYGYASYGYSDYGYGYYGYGKGGYGYGNESDTYFSDAGQPAAEVGR